MADTPPLSMQETYDFPSEDLPTDIRICEEEGCSEPAKKRGRGFSRWCSIHIEDHKGEKANDRPRNTATKTVAVTNDRAAKKAEQQALTLMATVQGVFLAKNDQYCAWAMGECAEPIAKNLGAVASDFKLVARMVDKTDKYFAITMLAYNVTRLGLMIGTHHEFIPYSSAMKILGVPEPPKKPIDASSHLRAVHNGDTTTDSASSFT